MSAATFATLGNVSIDDLVFDDGSTLWRVPGGNAIYSGLGVAVWQARPFVVAPIGPDYPIAILNGRIDLSRCRGIGATLRDWGLYEEDGSRNFVFRSHVKDWLDYCPTIDDIGGLGCRFAHLAPLPWDLQVDLALALRAQGARVIAVDPDDRYLSRLVRDQTLRLLRAVDMFLPSKQDAEAMFPGLSPLEALRRLRGMAPDLPVIAVKQGDRGVIVHQAGEGDYLEMPTAAQAVVDTTGAGDAFSGGALAGFADAGSALEAALRGSVSASFAVATSGPGGLVAATPEEARDRLDRLRPRVDAHPL